MINLQNIIQFRNELTTHGFLTELEADDLTNSIKTDIDDTLSRKCLWTFLILPTIGLAGLLIPVEEWRLESRIQAKFERQGLIAEVVNGFIKILKQHSSNSRG